MHTFNTNFYFPCVYINTLNFVIVCSTKQIHSSVWPITKKRKTLHDHETYILMHVVYDQYFPNITSDYVWWHDW